MFLSYFFRSTENKHKEQLPLKEQFLQNMKAINNFFFINLLSKEDINECSELQQDIRDGEREYFDPGYTSEDVKKSCNYFFKHSDKKQENVETLFKVIEQINYKIHKFFSITTNTLGFKISSKYNPSWHIDSIPSTKTTIIDKENQIGIAITVELIGGKGTVFVKEGQENFKPIDNSRKIFTPPSTEEYSTDEPVTGEAAIFLATTTEYTDNAALHSAPDRQHGDLNRLSLIFFGRVDLEKFSTPTIIDSIAKIDNTAHHLLDIKLDEMDNIVTQTIVTTTREAMDDNPTHNKAQFVDGLLLGKIIVAPVVSYASKQIKGEDTDQSFIEYYQENLPEVFSSIAKSALFFTISIFNPMTKKHGLANQMMANKVTVDLIFNAATLKVNNLYKMLSTDYAKELTCFAAPSLYSMTGCNNLLDIDQILEDHALKTGIIIGSGSEIIDLIGNVGSYTYNALSYDEDITT